MTYIAGSGAERCTLDPHPVTASYGRAASTVKSIVRIISTYASGEGQAIVDI